MKRTMTTKLIATLLVLFTGSLFGQIQLNLDYVFEPEICYNEYTSANVTLSQSNSPYLAFDDFDITLNGEVADIAQHCSECSGAGNVKGLVVGNNELVFTNKLTMVQYNLFIPISLSNSCSEICDNNIDDDGDGYVDEGCVLNLVNFKEDCEVGKVLLYPIPDGLGDDIEVVVTDGSGNTVPLLTPVLGGAGNTRLSYETVSPLGDQENYTVTVTAMNSNAQITKTLTSSASTPPTIPAIVYNSVHGEWNVKARSSSVNNNGTCPEIFTLELSTTSDFSNIIESVSYTKAHSAVWTVNNFLDVRDLCDVLYARVVSNKHGSSAVQSFEPWTWDGSTSCTGNTTREGLRITEVKLYPNPFAQGIMLEVPSNEEVTVEVYNSLGLLVETRAILGSELLGENLDSGNYIIKVISSSDIHTFNVIKE